MLSAAGLVKSYGIVRAVRGVSFELPAGTPVGLLGPNGAGKSTTIRMLTGYLPPDEGRITVCGYDLLHQSENARASIGYLPESAPLYPEMSVRGYLRYRAGLYGIHGRDARARSDVAAGSCGLTAVTHRRIGTLSKGFRQRVGLASALIHNPRVLILDEPTNGLDPTQIVELRRVIGELATDRAVLVSSHVLDEIERLCSRVIVIAGGKIRADGPPQTLIDAAGGVRITIIESDTDPQRTTESLSRLPGVSSVQTVSADRGWTRFRIGAASDIRADAAKSIGALGGTVRELTRDVMTLERAFFSILEQAATDDARDGTANA